MLNEMAHADREFKREQALNSALSRGEISSPSEHIYVTKETNMEINAGSFLRSVESSEMNTATKLTGIDNTYLLKRIENEIKLEKVENKNNHLAIIKCNNL